MTCKGIECVRHKATKPRDMGRYQAGQCRCQECVIFMNYNGDRCPCCNTKLRKNPRSAKYKTNLRNNERQKYGADLHDRG